MLFFDRLQTELMKLKTELSKETRELKNLVCPIEENFAFELKEQRQCFRCNHMSWKSKNELVLQLEMPDLENKKSMFSVDELFNKTLRGNGLDIKCSNCANGDEKNIHQTCDLFHKLPRVLILYLPRTHFIQEQKNSRKNRVKIHVNAVLDLKDHCEENVDTSKCNIPKEENHVKKAPRKRKSSFTILDELSPISSPEKKIHKPVELMSEEEQISFVLEQVNKQSPHKTIFIK